MDVARAYEVHHGPLLRFILSRVGDISVAEDLASTVWERAVRHSDRIYSWLPWLRQVARTAIVDHYRSRREVMALQEWIPTSTDTEHEAIARLELEAVGAALPCLSPREAQAIGLRAIMGLSEKGIAARTGRSLSAVHMAACRGRKKLRAALMS